MFQRWELPAVQKAHISWITRRRRAAATPQSLSVRHLKILRYAFDPRLETCKIYSDFFQHEFYSVHIVQNEFCVEGGIRFKISIDSVISSLTRNNKDTSTLRTRHCHQSTFQIFFTLLHFSVTYHCKAQKLAETLETLDMSRGLSSLFQS